MKQGKKKKLIQEVRDEAWKKKELKKFADWLALVADSIKMEMENGDMDFNAILIEVHGVRKHSLLYFDYSTNFFEE